MQNLLEFYQSKISNLKEKNQLRELKNITDKNNQYIVVDNKSFINLSSNDYLGLGTDQRLVTEFLEYIKNSNFTNELSFTSSSSRLLTGNSYLYTDLENLIAKTYNRQKALIFNSGYHLNIGLISSLVSKNDVIFSDKLNHASIIDGMKLSGADFYRYNHLNYEQLENLLQKYRNNYQKAIIVTESVFSMDGDIANLTKLVELKEKYNCLLYVDEAHAVGVFGKSGLGICEEQNIIDKIDIITGTFGKALASLGAFCVMDEILYHYIINSARSLIFTTALPPINLLWTKFIFEKISTMNDKRIYLKNISTRLKEELNNFDFTTISQSQIIPVIIGDNDKTLKYAKLFQDNDILLMAIRPPTVPDGSSRLRLSLTANLTDNDIENIINTFKLLKDLI